MRYLPCKCIKHAAACCHDGSCSEEHTDKRKPGSAGLSQQSRASNDSDTIKAHIRRHIAPALLLVAFLRICKSGPAAEFITKLTSPQTKSRTTRKIVPVKVPITTEPTMILGPSVLGLGISILKTVSKQRLFLRKLAVCLIEYIPSIMWATASCIAVSLHPLLDKNEL